MPPCLATLQNSNLHPYPAASLQNDSGLMDCDTNPRAGVLQHGLTQPYSMTLVQPYPMTAVCSMTSSLQRRPRENVEFEPNLLWR